MFVNFIFSDFMPLLWKLNSSISFMLFGLVLIIQFVHYPSFIWIDEEKFGYFQQFHTRAITYIVAPLMMLEISIALALLFFTKSHLLLVSLNMIIVILIWVSTYCLSVPCHRMLKLKKDEIIIKKLIHTNWYRTILWGIKSMILLFWVQ